MGARAEGGLERGGLGGVVEQRGGAVRVDVVDVGGAQARVGERDFDRPCGAGALRLGSGEMECVGGRADANQAGEDRGAAGERRPFVLEHQHTGALAHQEAVAARLERAADAAGRGGVHVAERDPAELAERRLRAADDGRIGLAGADQAHAAGYGVGTGRTGGHGGEAVTAQSMAHRDRRGAGVGDREGDAKRRAGGPPAFAVDAELGFHRADAADAGAHHARDAEGVERHASVPAGVAKRLLGRGDRQLHEAVGATQLFLGAEVGRVKRGATPERRRWRTRLRLCTSGRSAHSRRRPAG